MAKKSQKANVENQEVAGAATKAAPKATQAVKNDMVCVMLNRPQGIKFLINNGKTVVKINGNAVNLKGKAKGILPIGGYGMTMVPRAQWEEVKRLYGRIAFFKNNLILEANDKASANDMADEYAEVRHGMEPVNVGDVKTEAFDGIPG